MITTRAWLVLSLVTFCTPAWADRPYQKGAVAAAHPLASEAGAKMLEQGGNAIDAAVAAALVMGVAGPYHSGLGGGGFAVVHTARDGATRVADFREVAPQGATREMFVRDGKPVASLSRDGALSVAVPGAMVGYLELQEKYGALPRAKVLAPAIAVAKKGFVVTPQYVFYVNERLECLAQDSEAAGIFLSARDDGGFDAPALGTMLKQPALAKTLEKLSREGVKAYLQGSLGDAIAKTVQSKGGLITKDDVSSYRMRWRVPLWGTYRGLKVATMPPPSAGGIAVLQVLGALERLGPKGLASREVSVVHTYIEALRRAYVDRYKFLGDSAATPLPTEALVSPAGIDALYASIDPKKATRSKVLLDAANAKKTEQQHTTHVSAMDSKGNAVALTTTVNFIFGSCLVAKGTGILLNDQMDDFAALPGTPNAYGLVTGEANAVAPGKIPLSSMSPTLVFDEKGEQVRLAVGSPGGSTIPTTVIQVVSHVVDGKLQVSRAVGWPRIHHQWLPDIVKLDSFALEPETRKALEAMGHTFDVTDYGWGDAEAVLRDSATGVITAGSDPRREGQSHGLD